MNIEAMLKGYLLNINEDIMTSAGPRPIVKICFMNIKVHIKVRRRSRIAGSASRRDVFTPVISAILRK